MTPAGRRAGASVASIVAGAVALPVVAFFAATAMAAVGIPFAAAWVAVYATLLRSAADPPTTDPPTSRDRQP